MTASREPSNKGSRAASFSPAALQLEWGGESIITIRSQFLYFKIHMLASEEEVKMRQKRKLPHPLKIVSILSLLFPSFSFYIKLIKNCDAATASNKIK